MSRVVVVTDSTASLPAEVAQARGILEAWEAGAGRGVVTHEGRMIENLHVEVARRVLATHEAISSP